MRSFIMWFLGVLSILFLSFPLSAMSFLPLNFSKKPEFSVSLLKTPDANRRHERLVRTQEKERLESQKEISKGRFEELRNVLQRRLAGIEEQKKEIRTFTAEQRALLSLLLTTREKIAQKSLEMSENISKVIDESLLVNKRFHAVLDREPESKGRAEEEVQGSEYAWGYLKELQGQAEALESKRATLKDKKELLIRDIQRFNEQYESDLKKRRQEYEHLQQRLQELSNEQELGYEQYHLRLLYSLQREEDEAYSLEREWYDYRKTLQETELALCSYELEEKKAAVEYVKQHLVFSLQDVDKALEEYREQGFASHQHQEALDKELQQIKEEHVLLEEKMKQLAAAGAEREHDTTYQKVERGLIYSEHKKLLNSYKRELEQGKVESKKLHYDIMRVMHDRSYDKTGKLVEEKIDSWTSFFSQRLRSIKAYLEKLRDREKEQALRNEELQNYSAQFTTKEANKQDSQVFKEISGIIKSQSTITQELFAIHAQVKRIYEEMYKDAGFLLKELQRERRSINIWQRSDKALSRNDLKQSYHDAVVFGTYLLRKTKQLFSREAWFEWIAHQDMSAVLYLFLFFILLVVFAVGFHGLLTHIVYACDQALQRYQGQVGAIYLSILRSFLCFLERHGYSIGIWFYLRLHIIADFKFIFASIRPLVSEYSVALFYLGSIPFLMYISRLFMQEIKKINQRMSFLFFTEALQERFLFLITSILYTSAILLPLRKAFLYSPIHIVNPVASPLPNVIYGAWTLIISIVLLFFFSKEDVLRFLPNHGLVWQTIQRLTVHYYYPVFIFVMGLFILINPYVGYSNFAMYLAFCIPTTLSIVWALLKLHNWLRRYSFFAFMKEGDGEEDEVVDRFENAKLYYGAFVTSSFLFMMLIGFIAVTRIWGFDYHIGDLWRGLSQEWVVTFGEEGDQIGFAGLLTLMGFLLSGFVLSSLFSRFVLTRLFEVFRTAQGAQNTFSRMAHYFIVCLMIIVGLYAIKLNTLVNYMLIALLFGISFGAKDLVFDFFAGLWILIERPIEIGNFIQTGEYLGTVKKIAARATTIRTARNFSVVIPNRELIAKPIINWGAGYYAVGLELKVIVPYSSDPYEMKQMITDIVSRHPMILRIPELIIRLDDFLEHGMLFFVRAFVSSRRVKEQWNIASTIRMDILRELKERGIKIPYPHRVLHTTDSFSVTLQNPLNQEHFFVAERGVAQSAHQTPGGVASESKEPVKSNYPQEERLDESDEDMREKS